MYNLLIVDDEIEILEWLKELFLYDSNLEVEVYTASLAKQAIKLLDEVRVDVVLTDIKMPGMNGIELYKQIKENWPNAQVIFLTGYRDHETLYEIVKNNEVRYILKTEGDDVIIAAVENAIKEQENRLKECKEKEVQAQMIKKAKYWIQKELMEQLVLSNTKETVTNELLQSMNLPFRCDYPVLLYVGKMELKDQRFDAEYRTLARILDIIQQNMPSVLHVASYLLEHNFIVLLIQPRLLDNFIDWNRVFRISSGALEYICTACSNQCDMVLSFAISRSQVNIKCLSDSYQELKRALVYNARAEESVIVNGDEVKEFTLQKVDTKGIVVSIPVLTSYLEQGKKEEFLQLLEELTGPLLMVESRYDMGALELYYNISMVFLKYINVNQLTERIPFYIGLYKLTNVGEHASWQEAVNYLMTLANIMFGLNMEVEAQRKDITIKKVENYIYQNLNKDLSLTILAEIGGFNASYLSRIFKQKYHCNLSEFVVRERIKKARELLIHTNKKISDIGEMVGYFSPHSFTRIFKSIENLTPGEYRSLYRTGQEEENR